MISRSWAVAMPEERGQDDRRDALEMIDEPPEPARAEHDPVPDTVDIEGVPYHVDRCAKCGVAQPRADGVCAGQNYTLDEFERQEQERVIQRGD